MRIVESEQAGYDTSYAFYTDDNDNEHSDLLGEYNIFDDALAGSNLLGGISKWRYENIVSNEGDKWEKVCQTFLPDGREVFLTYQVEKFPSPYWSTVYQLSPGDEYWLEKLSEGVIK